LIGHLLTVTSTAEHNFVNTTVRRLGQQVWIGASDTLTEGSFVWVDGPEKDSAAPTSFWATGEPSTGASGNSNDCACYNTSGEWKDHACANLLEFIVEFERKSKF
jgi:hypothetical protein